jgi:hypothetical protein
MLVLSLKTEPSGGSYRRNGGLQTPYNGIALLEFQGFAQKFNASKKRIHPDNPWCFDRVQFDLSRFQRQTATLGMASRLMTAVQDHLFELR